VAEPKVSILLTLVDKLTAPVEGAKGKLASFGDAVTGVGAKIAALGVSAALGVFFKSAVEEAAKAEASTIRLGHAVRNAGEDFDTWAPQIDETINRLAKLTTFTDDDLASALGNLITKTGDVAGSMKNMGLVTDLAANRNISLEESATLVAKALNGGGRLFKEYGITVGTAAEKTEQLANILDGSAAAAADSFGGRLSNLGKAWGELKEGVGTAIIQNEAVGDALSSLTVLIDTLAPKVAEFVGFIVTDVVTSIQRFVTEVQTFGANAALAILGVPDRFKLAWGELMVAISNSIADSRVLMTVFGDGLTKIADKMGDNGVRMVRESQANLRNLKTGYEEVVAGIGKTVAKGEDDKTAVTRKGNKLRLEDTEATAKQQKEVWTGSSNVFIEDEKRRAAAAKEAEAVIRATWGLSSDYILKETAKVVTAHRAHAAALDTIIDGMDGVYGSSTGAAPAVKEVGSEIYNAARGAISLAEEFGTIDATAASVLNNVVNLADSLKDGLKGIAAGNLIGAIGSLAGLLGTMFSDGPQEKARKELILKNTQRLQELKDRMGELLNLSTPGGTIAKLRDVDTSTVVSGAAGRARDPQNRGRVSVAGLSAQLGGMGLTVTDIRKLAGELGVDLGERDGYFDGTMLSSFLEFVKSGTFSGFDSGLTGQVERNDWMSEIFNAGPGGTLKGLADVLGGPGGSSALGGLFSGVNLADGTDGMEAADIRTRTQALAARFATGGVTEAEMGGASNSQFMSVISTIIGLLDSIANTNATTASAVTSGGIGTVADTDMGASIDLSTAAVGG